MPSKPTLIVTVDTEEEGLWSGDYRPHGNTVANIAGVPRFQQVCEQFEIRPTYLVDWPVVEDDQASGILADLHTTGRCEIGAHLHPWCNPPFEESINARNSYMCNLSESLQSAKLTSLTERIEDRFGVRPTSFRAGRYGLSMTGARILARLGYRVDSSVLPFCDFRDWGGPDYSNAPIDPYYLDGDNICQSHEQGLLLELPVCSGFNWTRFESANRLLKWIDRSPLAKLRVVGLLDRLGIVQRIKLGPEQSSARRMNRLVDAYRQNGATCLVMMMHSSSFVPGLSPYTPDTRSLDRFFEQLAITLSYCRQQLSMATATLSEYAMTYDRKKP